MQRFLFEQLEFDEKVKFLESQDSGEGGYFHRDGTPNFMFFSEFAVIFCIDENEYKKIETEDVIVAVEKFRLSTQNSICSEFNRQTLQEKASFIKDQNKRIGKTELPKGTTRTKDSPLFLILKKYGIIIRYRENSKGNIIYANALPFDEGMDQLEQYQAAHSGIKREFIKN